MCGVFRPIHSSQIYKYTNTLTCVPLTCPGLHMEHLHYQGQQAQLATLEGPQIPHLGQWAVELHCPTNAKLPSGEVHMSRSRERPYQTNARVYANTKICAHKQPHIYIFHKHTHIFHKIYPFRYI